MSFRLKTDESLRKGLRRISREQIDAALKSLHESQEGLCDEAIHEARKSLKRLRAVLQLARPQLGGGLFRKCNRRLRSAARQLANVRDAEVLAELAQRLADEYQAGPEPASPIVGETLQTIARAARQRVLNQPQSFPGVAQELRKLRARANEWTDVPNRWRSIGQGLGACYGRAADAFAAAKETPDAPHLHEWRKRTKYLRYQLELLWPLCPEQIESLANQAERLGELLGDDHDLTLLRNILADHQSPFRESNSSAVLLPLIVERQTGLRAEAMILGRSLFSVEPTAFVRPLKEHWSQWRDSSRQ